jgi:hypothetical protein
MTRRYTGGFLSAKEQATDTNSANGIFTLQEANALTTTGNFPTGGWTPQASVKFRSRVSADLSRTPASAGNKKTWTFSAWVKRGDSRTGSTQFLFGTNFAGTGGLHSCYFNSDGSLTSYLETSSGTVKTSWITTNRFLDCTAWYHITFVFDTTQANVVDRCKIYVNNVRQAVSLNNYSASYIAQNGDGLIAGTTLHTIGSGRTVYGYYFDGYMSEINYVNGQALAPTSFGQVDAETGVWVPKRYTGTYGTTGFYLNPTEGNLAYDQSGNGNNWTASNMNISGQLNDFGQVDVPGIASVSSAPDVGGVQRGNYSVMNINDTMNGTMNVYDGNLRVASGSSSSVNGVIQSTLPLKGKRYFEVTVNSYTEGGSWYVQFGLTTGNSAYDSYQNAQSVKFQKTYVGAGGPGVAKHAIYWLDTTNTENSLVSSPGIANNDVYMFAYDDSTRQCWVGKNGTWFNNGAPSTGTNPIATLTLQPLRPDVYAYYAAREQANTVTYNFGQRPFSYTPPTGFGSVTTTTLPNPVIKRPSNHFDTKIYGGNSRSLTVGDTAKQTSAVQIPNSLRFKRNATAYLSKTYTSTATDKKTMTFSSWVKPGSWGNGSNTFFLYGTYNNYENCGLVSPDNTNSWAARSIRITGPYMSGQQGILITNPIITNPSAWYHIMVVYDTSNAAPSERIRLYVNGVRIVSFSSFTASNQNNTSTEWLSPNSISNIGITGNSKIQTWDGEMAEVNIVDGQALQPTSFGQFDANNNWVPKAYTGTYGNNGAYLPFRPVDSFGTTNYAVRLNTNAQYLSIPDNAAFNFGTGSYTIEAWINTGLNVKPGQGTADGWICPIGSYNGASAGWYVHIDNAGCLLYGTNGGTELYSTTKVNDGQWHHIAIVRSGSSSTTMYVDGNAVVAAASTNSGYSGTAVRIGSLASTYDRYYSGLISNVRITKGVAVYTGNFTVPTLPLTATQSAGTNISAITAGQCSLLTCNSSTIVDNSGNNFTITNNGSISDPFLDYITARSIASDYSGRNQHWATTNHVVAAPTVLTYGTPGTYTWTAPAGVTSVEVLVVAGGGGGQTGGGGAGGVIYNTSFSVTPSSSYTVTVGAGGAPGVNGSNSVFSSLTAIGGGYGASSSAVGNGGSGGGGYYGRRSDGLVFGPMSNGTGTAGQGFAGGNYTATGNPPSSSYAVGGGGGGAGGPGITNNSWTGGNGGPGIAISITGFPTYYAGGGGGQAGYSATGGLAGIGGGGNAYGSTGGGVASTGVDGLGGGGGGGSERGGSGVVILKYSNANSYVGTGANTFEAADNIIDVPCDYVDSNGLTHGNYAVLDVRRGNTSYTAYSNSLLKATAINDTATNFQAVYSTLGFDSGKYYAEFTVQSLGTNNSLQFGVGSYDYGAGTGNMNGYTTGVTLLNLDNSTSNQRDVFVDGNATGLASGNPTWAVGDILGMAVNADDNKVYFYKNGTLINTDGPITRLPNAPLYFISFVRYYTTGSGFSANFGQLPFKYSGPTGYKPLCSKSLKDFGSYNLPDTFGNSMNTPDLIWVKSRTNTYNHLIQDTMRGTEVYVDVTTSVQTTTSGIGIQEFLPNGFTIGSIAGGNRATDNHVAWMWNRGKTPGFDMVTYVAVGGTNPFYVPHNLGVPPAFILSKCLTRSAGSSWYSWHQSFTNAETILLNSDAAKATYAGSWADGHTSTHLGMGSNISQYSGETHIAYAWAEVPGFSKFGTYVGNGSAAGPYINCGFRPAFIMVKASSAIEEWVIVDNKRDPANSSVSARIYPHVSSVENSSAAFANFFANGFMPNRSGDGTGNVTGRTYIYAAFAESPFKYANAR